MILLNLIDEPNLTRVYWSLLVLQCNPQSQHAVLVLVKYLSNQGLFDTVQYAQTYQV